jgi:hypothetical protein
VDEFLAYKKTLDEAVIPPMDENLMYLLERLTDLLDIDEDIAGLPDESPFLDKILLCLGRLFGDDEQPDEDVMLIARYQIASKSCLDGSEFVRELDALDTFPDGRSNFPLGDFLIDPNVPVGLNRTRAVLTISSQTELFRALRNILAGICCKHPCVLKVHGWNIVKQDQSWSVLIDTDEAQPFSIAAFQKLGPLDQSEFLLSLAIGMLEIHCRGVFHNNLKDERSIQVKNGRAQICNFELLDDTASFKADTVASQTLFRHDPLWPAHSTYQAYIASVLREEAKSPEGSPLPLREVADAIANEATPKSFPFDLFFHLVHSSELWKTRHEPLDVGGALAQLTRGLDGAGAAGFRVSVNDHLDASNTLHLGMFK